MHIKKARGKGKSVNIIEHQETKLLKQLWSLLRGDINLYIELSNLQVGLAAIINLCFPWMLHKASDRISKNQHSQDKQSASPSSKGSISSHSTTKSKAWLSNIGLIDTKGEFYFKDASEVRRVHNHFKLLSQNRYDFIANKSASKALSRQKSCTKATDQSEKTQPNLRWTQGHVKEFKETMLPNKDRLKCNNTSHRYSASRVGFTYLLS